MAIDFSTWNGGSGDGYIVEEISSKVVQQANAVSAIEAYARKENMTTSTKLVPRLNAGGPNVFAEGDTITQASAAEKDAVVLEARKWARIFEVSEEDLNDSFVDVLNKFKIDWANKYARKFDHACLGVSAAENGTTIPYTSLYKELTDLDAGLITPSAGDITFTQLNDLLGQVEASAYFDPSRTMFMAHPTLMKTLRGLVDDNHRPILQEPLAGTTGSLFGYPVKFTTGAAVDSTAQVFPTGNPFIAVGNMDMLINGTRAGIESAVSRDAKFDTDGVLLKIRARRAFKVAKPEAFAILEKTAAE